MYQPPAAPEEVYAALFRARMLMLQNMCTSAALSRTVRGRDRPRKLCPSTAQHAILEDRVAVLTDAPLVGAQGLERPFSQCGPALATHGDALWCHSGPYGTGFD